MFLKAVATKGFRNLLDAELEFDVGNNYFFGGNAAGKTSLLEAVHYLAIGRSFRLAQERDVVKFGSEVFSVRGDAMSGGEARRGEIRSDGVNKKLVLDGVEVDRLSSYLGWLPVVTMLLDDIRLVRGGPGERRAFLDLALSKVSRAYLLALSEYRRVLVRRNRVLSQTTDAEVLRTWEMQLARAGTQVYKLRGQYLPELLESATGHASGVLDHGHLDFTYRASVPQEGDVESAFLAAIEQGRERERMMGVTLAGPHRDDILIRKNGMELRRFGSEGEQRSASIALKLAEAGLLRRLRDEAPVFLLDEIASELDAERTERLFALLGTQGQLFYAAAKPFAVKGRVFKVEAGKVQEA